MAYFRQLDESMEALLDLFDKEERWLIVINADPDALASASALKRIMGRRVATCDIARINKITRPDNLAMMQYLRIKTELFTPLLAAQYDRFAMVDSQPHHNKAFNGIEFPIVIDHHPESEEHPVEAAFKEIRPDYGACSSMLTEYLYNLKIRPAKLLATALMYGIKTDTRSFERNFNDADLKAFKYNAKYADHLLTKRIVRSEFRKEWLGHFSEAIKHMREVGKGVYVHMGEVKNPDILVILADFFLRVHGFNWTVVSGTCLDTLIIILRGDGIRKHVGEMAHMLFSQYGGAGGHREAARAEIELGAIKGRIPEEFVFDRLALRNSKSLKLRVECGVDTAE